MKQNDSNKPPQNDVTIELHVPDFEITKKFYKKLGFDVIWERKPEADKGYLVMKRDNSIICFYCGNSKVFDHSYFKRFSKTTKKGYAFEIVIVVDDIDETYKKCKKFANIVENMKIKPWGLKDFRLEDPFGFYLRITEPHNILHSGNAVK